MLVLPAIRDKVTPHNAPYVKKGERFVPDAEEIKFWNGIYKKLADSGLFEKPLSSVKARINPYFGHFGLRWDPETLEQQAYHTGVDIESRRKTNVKAMAEGVLEYAGYGLINGKYVMLSHPKVTTEDGFTLHTLYMHLDACNVSFSSYQKMLRQISLNSYPIVPIEKSAVVGVVGKTGTSSYPPSYTHVHIQAEFHNKEGVVVHVDPVRLLGIAQEQNLTAGLTTKKQFIDVYLRNRKDIFKRKLQDVWKESLGKYQQPIDIEVK